MMLVNQCYRANSANLHLLTEIRRLARRRSIRLDLLRKALLRTMQLRLVLNLPKHGLSEMMVLINGQLILDLFILMVISLVNKRSLLNRN
jgi:hypothetical protein